MKNFVLIGLAGYVAPKHLMSIKEVDGNLLAALDPHDSVGVVDSYFPDCQFFTEFERFSKFCETYINDIGKIDYVVVCSPNYLHMSHCIFALRIGADVICEKPVVLHYKNIMKLIEMEEKFGKRVYPILQTRYHPKITELKEWCKKLNNKAIGSLYYNTPRGDWYKYSWKSDVSKSGGLITNIGIHLVDLLVYMFGEKWDVFLYHKEPDFISGVLSSNYVDVDFILSIRRDADPVRILDIDGYKVDFTEGFSDLHPTSYKNIIEGNGFLLEDTKTSILICEEIRNGLPNTPISIHR